MTTRCHFRVLLACLLAGLAPQAATAAGKPNVLIILTDDMGFSDLGCYGGEIATPHLDALAKGGLRFTQFYNTARCCPTRASLLTGLYPHQAGVGHMMDDKGYDGYRGDLNGKCVTIAEVLKPAGYGTYAVGKWHVTRFSGPKGPKHNWPLQRGFDGYYGTDMGGRSYYDPAALTRGNTMISPYADPEYKPKTYYYTHAISEHAVRFLQEHHKEHPDKPFFLYTAYTAAHWPMHALAEDVAKYKGKYDKGYEALRRARFERTKKLGVIDAKWKLSPDAGTWADVKTKAWEARCMEVYAAMVTAMDEGVGRIVATLKKQGQLDNTLILFLQDNGGCAELIGRDLPKDPVRLSKPTLPVLKSEALELAVRPKQTRDGWPVLGGRNVMPGPRDTFIAYGREWANVAKTPFREYNDWVHEGGTSPPLIAHWPAGIKAKGALRHQPGHVADLMATCVDVAGAKYPKTRKGEKVQPMEGTSLVPAFAGKALKREAIYWEHEGNRAVRVGQWTLVANGEKGPWELYDVDADRTELTDLAKKHPERVKTMAALWQRWAERGHVLPLDPRKPEKKR